MARINVEDIWWSDPRRSKLIAKLGSEYIADGLMISMWRISQDYNGVPFDYRPYFSQQDAVLVASTGLASLEHHLLYVKGSKDKHDWLISRRSAASRGGKKSAELRQAPLEQPLSITQPSYSYSSSVYKKKKGKEANASPPNLLKILGKYSKCYSSEFVTREVERCKEYHYSKSGKEASNANISYWLRSDLCVKSWEKWKFDHGVDPLIEFLKEESRKAGINQHVA